VRESLRERAILLRNAPRLCRRQAFVVPAYSQFDRVFYGAGLKVYDALSGKLSLGPSELITREEVLRELPTVRAEGLKGGTRYFDGQFDDARLAICLAQTVHALGGFAVNYTPALELLKENGRVAGVIASDAEMGRTYRVRARVVINATGVFTDEIRALDEPKRAPLVTASQGAHIVVDRSFLPGGTALMVPKTRDGRVLFAIPWLGRTVIGTTDTPVNGPVTDPQPFSQEIDFLMEHAGLYLAKAVRREDIRASFAGLRPLVKASTENTAKLSRDHTIVVSSAGLVTIAGGKWTTYRKMAEDVVNRAAEVGGLATKPCRTENLRLDDSSYHSEANSAEYLTQERIIAFVRDEMARTVEDVLARRTRLALLDERAALAAVPMVAAVLREELGRSST
jgi:glycerol-3-phosphate dehydrogenase